MKGAELQLNEFFDSGQFSGVIAVYLFGSCAEGRAIRESDVDVGVLLDREVYPTSADRFEMRVRLGSELGAALKKNEIDVVILNEAPPLFARKIVLNGIRVYCADPEEDRVFVRDAQLRAADLEPFLRRMRHLKVRALAR